MESTLKSPQGKEVIIADGRPTVLIGERINPFGKGAEGSHESGDMEPIRQEALKQAEAGADILIVSVATFGIDEAVLPQVFRRSRKRWISLFVWKAGIHRPWISLLRARQSRHKFGHRGGPGAG